MQQIEAVIGCINVFKNIFRYMYESEEVIILFSLQTKLNWKEPNNNNNNMQVIFVIRGLLQSKKLTKANTAILLA